MLTRLFATLRGLLSRRQADGEVDDELRFHVEQETAANVNRGLSPDEARHLALRDLGGLTQTREAVRSVRRIWLDTLWQEIRHAARMLRRSPGFATLAILVLALGIGVNTAVFSIVNAVFFRPLAIAEPDSLVYIYQHQMSDQRAYPTSVRDIKYFQSNTEVFSGFSAHWGRNYVIAADGESDIAWGEVVVANYFDFLGVQAALGRTFAAADDDVANTQLSIVISHDLWARRFKSDPAIIGKSIRAGSQFFKIIGVMGPSFTGLSDPWRPARWWVTVAAHTGTEAGIGMGVMARLKPGATLDQAKAVVAVQAAHMQQEQHDSLPAQYRRPNFRPSPYLVRRAADVQMPFDPDARPIPARLVSAVGVVVGIVLLIAIANIAGILLARGVTRTNELAVRQALGASATHLVRQLLTESVLLSAAGGLTGLFIAWLGVGLYQAYTPTRFLVDVPLDLRILLFTGALCLGAGVLVGLMPALQARKVDVLAALGGSLGAGATRRVSSRLRHSVVIPQVALAVALLTIAGVHVRTLSGIESRDLGYRSDGVVSLEVDQWDPAAASPVRPPDTPARIEQRRAFVGKVFDRIRDTPGADATALVLYRLPLFSRVSLEPYTSQEPYFSGSPDTSAAGTAWVSPGYFRTLRMSLLRGRDFDDRDTLASPRVAIISDSLAKRWWPVGNAIGKSVASYSANTKPEWREIVGVVNEIEMVLPDDGPRPLVYMPVSQVWNPYWVTVIVRGPHGPANLVQTVRGQVIGVDTFAQVTTVRTLKQMAAEALYPRRTAASLLTGAGFIGLLLSSIGLYGVVSYSVARRLREIGIRATLGAGSGDLLALVLREGLTIALVGAVPGAGLSLLALRLTSNIVGPVPAVDFLTLGIVLASVGAVVLLACYWPARRAARVDPMVVLRGL